MGCHSHLHRNALRGLATIQDKSPAAGSANSHFLTRTSNEGLMLRTLMRYLMPQDVLNIQEQRLQTTYDFLSSVDSWTQRMQSKPNLYFMGFVSLSEQEFVAKFDTLTIFLNHMFEKHHGEIIHVSRWTAANDVAHPGTIGLHHDQFYVGDATRDTTQA